MKLTIIAVGTRMPDWVQAGYSEYAKRLPRECALELKEIPLATRSKNTDIARAIEKESESILASIPAQERVIALDVLGKPQTTQTLADALRDWQMQGGNTSLLIGGPDGLSVNCLARANQRWSLSGLTLPHPLVRIVLAEQLYRAWSLLNHHPYHR
ncbi:MAG: 23S rRNA (pseudouridine(1915)-N(3))-methyltransferase RlmH [Pseudomonadales bacterium]|jgi:23S rRNA (pseudouridine1915-N3)-methyltransferase|nr:23S rRNA (pseudouridine(1915)-N(3))-methyltransferase RlmH [Cellvibrionales bacterium]MBP8030186.1 23S rRNA (pseudouridine(1915)-N(3))-methyltransferase RlmH [Pseudomonadales bacterium]